MSYPVTEHFLVELGGLLVPMHLDCDRNRSAHWNVLGLGTSDLLDFLRYVYRTWHKPSFVSHSLAGLAEEASAPEEYGCMNYFYASPGRWTNCYLHEALLRQNLGRVTSSRGLF